MSKNIILIGASGHARVIADIVRAGGDNLLGFLDDDLTKKNVLGPVSDFAKYPDAAFLIGIGNADVREKLSHLPVKWHTAIHPSAIISPSAKIGEGTVVMPGAVINADAVIGKHCIVNTTAVVEHDNKLGDFAHISVGAKLGGTVSIGRKTWIGIGATVINNVSICDNCMIGAGAIVVGDVKKQGVYVGVPAKEMRK